MSTPQKLARRKKRIARTNGDQQYFRAVNRLRRHKIDTWQVNHAPRKFALRLAQLTLQAVKRQAKQEERDRARKATT